MRAWWTILWLGTACTWAPADGTDEWSPDGEEEPMGAAAPMPPTQKQPEASAATKALVGEADAALTACRDGALAVADVEAAAAAPFPFDEAALRAQCGALMGLYDAHVDAHAGTTRSADFLLSALARGADDLDQLVRAVGSDDGSQRREAVQHVSGALDHLERVVRAVEGSPDQPYTVRLEGAEADQAWSRLLDGDRMTLERLYTHLHRYALDQGPLPELVRGRMVRAFGDAAAATIDARREALAEAALPADETAARTAYLDVAEAWVRVYRDVGRRYAEGQAVTPEAREQATAETERAHEVWKVAWDAERDRTAP